MKKEDKPDLQVDGQYSPISLDKVIKSKALGDPSQEFKVLIDGTGMGIRHDSDECVYITPNDCYTQANHYRENIFNGTQISAYLYRHLVFMFSEERDGYKYKTDQDVADAMNKGEVTTDSDEFKMVLGLIKYCDTNKEAAQVIGLIQLMCGSLNMAKKANSCIKLYIDKPETNLHPKREAAVMMMFTNIKDTYK